METINNNPLISVIVPIYNVEKYLEKCIDSIINQTYKNLEIILVEDGSPDNCGEICDEYAKTDARVKVIHKKNGGSSDARNAGMKMATGDYITFVDSDDWLELNLYEKIMQSAEIYDDVIIFGLKYINLDGNTVSMANPGNIKFEVNDENITCLINLVKTSMLGYVWNKIYKKDVINDICFRNIRLCEDLCFNFKILNKIQYIRCVDVCGYNYLQRLGSILHKSNIKNIEDINEINIILSEGVECVNKKNNVILYNNIMQRYLSDVVIRDIIRNDKLDGREKINHINKIFSNKNIIKKLKISLADNKLLLLMILCMKTNQDRLFYKICKCIN